MRCLLLSLGTVLALAGCASLPGIYELPLPSPVAATPVVTPGPGASTTAGTPPAAAPAPAVATIGQVAPDIAFTAIGGQRQLLSAFRGKFVALVFFAHW